MNIYIYIYIYVYMYIYIVEHKACSVTSEPTQSSSRHVSSLKDSSVLLYQLNDVTFKIQLYFNSYKSSNSVLSNSTKAR